ncbi:MAG: hypothetical protein ACKO8I_17020 [Cyanobacteriota bacterium]
MAQAQGQPGALGQRASGAQRPARLIRLSAGEHLLGVSELSNPLQAGPHYRGHSLCSKGKVFPIDGARLSEALRIGRIGPSLADFAHRSPAPPIALNAPMT